MTGPRLLHRPIFGGLFGRDRYFLATVPAVERGLHTVRFMVIEPAAGTVLSVGDSQAGVLAGARRVLRAALDLAAATASRAAPDAPWHQAPLWDSSELDAGVPKVRLRPISKRRREVFTKSQGRCHYCAEVLTLDGRWHVEHMLPKALGGADELPNLVAACAPCNLAKRDRTAIEYLASRGECDA